jgi:hypothetical protein
LLYAAQSPFTISFTPTRLGSASFGAIERRGVNFEMAGHTAPTADGRTG